MYKVYGDYRSGNCYKIKLAMSLLGIDYQWVPVDILKGETQTPEFLAKSPNGKIPVLELEDGSCLWESNAILNFLADGSALLPSEPRLRTQVLQWQFFEQYSHEPYVAVARFIKLFLYLLSTADHLFLRPPAVGQFLGFRFQVLQFVLKAVKALLAGDIGFLLHRLFFDPQLDDLAVEFVDFFRFGVDFHPPT